MYRPFFIVFVLLALASFLPGRQPPPAPPEQSVPKLIEQLGDQDFKVREAAVRAIEKLGPEALPALRKAKDHPDPEVRRRVEKWIPEFETLEFVAPKLISMDVKDRPLHDVVKELAKQSGYKIEFAKEDGRLQKAVSFKFDKLSFWEAFDKVCLAGGMTLSDRYRSSDGLNLAFDQLINPHVSHQGAFRVSAGGFYHSQECAVTRRIEFEGRVRPGQSSKEEKRRDSESFSFQFTITAESRLLLLAVDEPRLIEAVDDQKQSLVPKKDPENEARHSMLYAGHFGGHYRCSSSVQVSLLAPSMNAKSLKVLRGTIPVYLQKEKKTVTLVDDLVKAQGKKCIADGLTVEIIVFKLGPDDEYRLYFTVAGKKPDAGSQRDAMEESFELEDAKGTRYTATSSMSGGPIWNLEALMSFSPDVKNPGPIVQPVKLLYIRNTPMLYHVPFEFKDLPLP